MYNFYLNHVLIDWIRAGLLAPSTIWLEDL